VNIAAFAVSIISVLVAAAAVLYARKLDSKAAQAVTAAARSAVASENSLRIEQMRRHQERRPKLSGDVTYIVDDPRPWLMVTLDPSSCPLTALEVEIRPRQGVSFRLGTSGVVRPASSTAFALRAFAYDYEHATNKPTGVQPGEMVMWQAELEDQYSDVFLLDATCHAEGKGEGEDQWTVAVEVTVKDRPEVTLE
jgi:hypothetical protein